MGLKHVNPDSLHRNLVFSQGVLLEGEGRLLVVGGQDVLAGVQASSEAWGPAPTAITVIQVLGFARPEVLVEIDALALVPERTR